ncbi:hypothetical protein [Mycoplasmopsis cricetuli]|uniref:hypothetical protein n=1 Tax=Mycoplasmopsis cricetuli TaxID=171283 RepID=UPI000472DFEA|nr:hypothetical protein [Mycoplasmopsis cricetuli]
MKIKNFLLTIVPVATVMSIFGISSLAYLSKNNQTTNLQGNIIEKQTNFLQLTNKENSNLNKKSEHSNNEKIDKENEITQLNIDDLIKEVKLKLSKLRLYHPLYDDQAYKDYFELIKKDYAIYFLSDSYSLDEFETEINAILEKYLNIYDLVKKMNKIDKSKSESEKEIAKSDFIKFAQEIKANDKDFFAVNDLKIQNDQFIDKLLKKYHSSETKILEIKKLMEDFSNQLNKNVFNKTNSSPYKEALDYEKTNLNNKIFKDSFENVKLYLIGKLPLRFTEKDIKIWSENQNLGKPVLEYVFNVLLKNESTKESLKIILKYLKNLSEVNLLNEEQIQFLNKLYAEKLLNNALKLKQNIRKSTSFDLPNFGSSKPKKQLPKKSFEV